MAANVQTYECCGGIGIAAIAKRLAYLRAYNAEGRTLDEWVPIKRSDLCILHVGAFPAAREYYQIIDRISRGERP